MLYFDARWIKQATLVYFFYNHLAPSVLYTLSLHDALPISSARPVQGRGRTGRVQEAGADRHQPLGRTGRRPQPDAGGGRDRKSTRLNSSHGYISYAVFCLKKKTTPQPLCRRHLAFCLAL